MVKHGHIAYLSMTPDAAVSSKVRVKIREETKIKYKKFIGLWEESPVCQCNYLCQYGQNFEEHRGCLIVHPNR